MNSVQNQKSDASLCSEKPHIFCVIMGGHDLSIKEFDISAREEVGPGENTDEDDE